jgi:Flp pilus assembly protein TadG
MAPRRKHARHCRRGVAAVEFALVLPILMILAFGLWEYGRLVEVQQILSNAAREGGRLAAVGSKSTSEVQEHVRMYLDAQGLNTAGMPTPEVTNLTSSDRNDPREAEQLDRFRIRVFFPTANCRWFFFRYTSANMMAESLFVSLHDVPVALPSEEIP